MSFVNRRQWSRWFRTFSLPLLMVGATYAVYVPTAQGQDDLERSGAREAARRGIDAFGQKRFAEALDLFKRAESVVHAPTHLLYIARSAVELGQLVLARETYLKVVREQLPTNAPNAFKDAQTAASSELSALEPRIPKLRIELHGDPNHTAQITLDDRPLTSALVGVAIPIDPGKHIVRATSPGMKQAEVEATVPEAVEQVAELKLEPQTAVALPTGTTPPSARSDSARSTEASHPNYLRIASYAAAGVGVVGTVVGTYFTFRAKTKADDGDALYAKYGCPNCSASQKAEVLDADDASANAKTLGAVGFVTGGVGIAAAVTLFVLSSRDTESRPNASTSQVAPYIGPTSLGVVGRF